MGNNQNSAIPLAIIKKYERKPYEDEDYFMFFSDKQHINPMVYESFQEFIEKQSLKNLHNVVIIEGKQDSEEIMGTKNSESSGIAEYMEPITKVLQKNDLNKSKLSIRAKIINYIKKYSIENLSLYIYVRKLKDFYVPESQVPYITMVSDKASTIINHMLSEQTEKMVNEKFKGLMKDLYRRKLVAVISKDYKQKDKKSQAKEIESKSNKNNEKQNFAQKPSLKISQVQKSTGIKHPQSKICILAEMEQMFRSDQNKFEYLFFSTIDQFRQKLKSMYFEFMICLDKENLLEIIQFKKRMPIQSKLIYYGQQKDLKQNFIQNGLNQTASQMILQKKLKQIWWISNNMKEQICPVMKKWWNIKSQNQNQQKIASNIIIYLCRCQNIIRKDQILKKVQQEIKRTKDQSYVKNMTISIDYKPSSVLRKYADDLYTNFVMLDANYEEFEEMKLYVAENFIENQPRIFVTLVEFKDKQKQKTKQDKLLDIQIQKCIQKFQLKFQQSPIQTIHCLNLEEDDIDFFRNKMGLKVKTFQTKENSHFQNNIKGPKKQNNLRKENLNKNFPNKNTQKNNKNIFQSYFPKYLMTSRQKDFIQDVQKQLMTKKLKISNTFQNFVIICNFQDYLQYIFPYLVKANFFDKQTLIYEVPSQEEKFIIQNYMKRIKVIIYSGIDLVDKNNHNIYYLNNALEIHKSMHSASAMIKKAIYDFLDLDISIYQSKKDSLSRKNGQKLKFDEIQVNTNMKLKDFTMFINRLEKEIIKKDEKKDSLTKIQSTQTFKIVFPNISFVHYKLSQIQQYINFCKYNKLSIPHFPKNYLKNLYQAYGKVETLVRSRSFTLDATFISSNNLLKEVFEKKNIQVSPTHKMDFVRFSLNKIGEITSFEEYIKIYASLWFLNFEIFNKSEQKRNNSNVIKTGALQRLKNDVKKTFQKCKNYELLKITTSQFKHFYVDRIEKCQTLLDLQISAIYIYSLPHGFSEIVNVIFQEPTKSALTLQLFSSFFFLLFANFYSFESKTIKKISTVIYVEEQKIKNLFGYIKQSEIVYNKNILHLLDDENAAENQKNHCVFIEYENIPITKKSSLTPILKIQNFAFYKQSAEFILAPFTKLKLKSKKVQNSKYKLYFDVVSDQENNTFLKNYFEQNNINDIVIFKALSQSQQEARKFQKRQQKTFHAQDDQMNQQYVLDNISNQKFLADKKITNDSSHFSSKTRRQTKIAQMHLTNKQLPKAEEFSSLYRQAQQTALNEEKEIVRQSIQSILSYTNMITSLKSNKIFSAQKYFNQIYYNTLNEINENQVKDKKYQQVKQEFQFEKLRIQQAMLYTKMKDYSKAIQQLTQLLRFIKYQKVEEKADKNQENGMNEGWLTKKVEQMKSRIQNFRKVRHHEIEKIPQIKKWAIIIDDQHGSCKTKMKNMPCKWKVSYNDHKQTFKMTNTNNMVWPINYDVLAISFKDFYDNKYTNQLEQNDKSIETRRDDQEQVKFGDLLYVITNQHVTDTLSLDIKGKGDTFEGDIQRMNTLFNNLRAKKQFRTLKLIHLYIRFWNFLFNKLHVEYHEVWQKLKQISQTYIMEKFMQIVKEQLIIQIQKVKKQKQKLQQLKLQKIRELTFIVFKLGLVEPKSQISNTILPRQQHIKQQGPKSIQKKYFKSEEQYQEFLIRVQKQFGSEQKMKKIGEQLLEEHLQREQQSSNKVFNQQNSTTKKNCWLDSALQLDKKQKQYWSVFEYDKKMIVVDANRKWKQTIGNGLSTASKVFNRTQNEVLDKIKKSKIESSISKQ